MAEPVVFTLVVFPGELRAVLYDNDVIPHRHQLTGDYDTFAEALLALAALFDDSCSNIPARSITSNGPRLNTFSNVSRREAS